MLAVIRICPETATSIAECDRGRVTATPDPPFWRSRAAVTWATSGRPNWLFGYLAGWLVYSDVQLGCAVRRPIRFVSAVSGAAAAWLSPRWQRMPSYGLSEGAGHLRG